MPLKNLLPDNHSIIYSQYCIVKGPQVQYGDIFN